MVLKKILKKIALCVEIIIILIVAIFLIANIYTFVAKTFYKKPNPMFFGFSNAIVVTGSMEKEINIGDMVIYQKKSKEDYIVGDIIVYLDENNNLITHRIISLAEDTLITKGDANNIEDSAIKYSQIQGKVIFKIGKIGKVISFFSTPLGIIVILVSGVLIIELPVLIQKKIKKRRE